MNQYKDSKIYKIVSSQTNKVYIGSTCLDLDKRLAKHKYNLKYYRNGNYCYVTSFEIVKYDDARIVLIEEYPCNDKFELMSREYYWIKKYGSKCINKCRNSVMMKKNSSKYSLHKIINKKRFKSKHHKKAHEEFLRLMEKQYYELMDRLDQKYS